MTKKYTQKEIESILDENKKLRSEINSMQKIINSRRFQFAEKVANMYNELFPKGSRRRKILKILYMPVVRFKQWSTKHKIVKIQRMIKPFKNIIVMHSIPWNTPLRQRPHHLAKCLTNEGFFVIYFEPDEAIKKFRKIQKNFITINSWDTVNDLKKGSNKNYYFFFNNVSNVSLEDINTIKRSGYQLVYEYIDEFDEDISGSTINQLEIWEQIPLSLKPTLILASATKLYDHAVQHVKSKENVILSKNAVNIEDFDYHNFSQVEIPQDLQSILDKKHNIVGYYGAISPWLDYKLISDVVNDNPKYEFVFIGVDYQNALKKLDQTPKNVHYLGPKPYKKLPIYSALFDAAIIPFETGEIAKGTSPVKLFEYMAMGLPTVCTKDLEECKGYNYIYIAEDAKSFSDCLKQAIKDHKKEDIKEKLLKEAKENSWQSRAHSIKIALEERQ